MDEFLLNCNQRGLSARGCGRQDKQLNSYNWLADIPGADTLTDLVEVQFKNTRKDYYINSNHLPLQKGDIVAVESVPGHDIGVVTMTGPLVKLQMKKIRLKADTGTRRVYRLAREVDMQKYEEAKAREHATMIRSRQIAKELQLEMKIGDVEYQGDGNKAIFYYIADQRVDFRKLIKVLAEEFKVRIEMKQIGARQEAGRIGGIGPCGRELCCATWMKNFVTVSINAARCQDVSLNPQKLAGQCAKLKCCLNYEISVYTEAAAKMPPSDTVIETQKGVYYLVKTDVLAGTLGFSTDKHLVENYTIVPVERVFDIIRMNQNGEKPADLNSEDISTLDNGKMDLATQESLTRFDKRKRKKKRKKGGAAPGGEESAPEQALEGGNQAEATDEGGNNADNRQGNPRRDRNRNRRKPGGNDSRQEQTSSADEGGERAPREGNNRRRHGRKPGGRGAAPNANEAKTDTAES